MSSVRYLHQGRVHAHIAIWVAVNGPIPKGMMVDHIDGDTHNNDIGNLRLATRAQNGCNAKLSTRNKSGLKGLRWNPIYESWRGTINYLGKTHTKNGDLLTVAAWLFTKREELHGEFARHR